MTLTEKEKMALQWTIAMLRPRPGSKHTGGVTDETANTLQALLDRAVAKEKQEKGI
jgi:hypothetical protein